MKVALALLATLVLTAAATTSRAAEPSCGSAASTAAIRARLRVVEEGLRQAPCEPLGPVQRAARARALGELHRYAEAGVFPHNHVSTVPRPIFVDEHGTLCAFANLLAFSGRSDFVRRVASERNAAKVADLVTEPAVTSWAVETGISLEEAAMIQVVQYEYTPEGPAVTTPGPSGITATAPSGVAGDAAARGPMAASAAVALAGAALVWIRRRRAARTLPTP